MRIRTPLLLAVTAVALVGCDVGGPFGPAGGPYPAACESLGFVPRQCAAIVAAAEDQAGIKAADAAAIEILPPTGGGGFGGHMISRVRFHLASGTDPTEEVWCPGTVGQPDACIQDPTIGISTRRLDHDVPCGGDSPGCATPPASPRPAVQAMARPLRVPILDIALDHLGAYDVDVGVAGLPDGAFTGSSASVVDERPTSFWIRDADLVIEPVDPKRPPVGSVFREPFDGVESVRVRLVFDVTELSPGAVLQVRDIVVE